MNKFYPTLLAATLFCTGASAQLIQSPEQFRNAARTESRQNPDVRKLPSREQRQNAEAAMRRHAPMAKAIAGPSADDKVIDEVPAGKMTQCVKSGFSYGYSWLSGLVFQNLYGAISNTVVSEDNKHLYIQNPISFNFLSEENWIVGDIEGDQVSFTFPQLIDVDTYYDDEGNIESEYRDYALKLEFVVEDEEEGTGWYYPCADQTYRFRLNDDGSLTSLEEDIMIGACTYIDGENLDEGEEPHWSWQGNGDFITDIKPLTETVPAVPDDIEFAEWQYMTETSHFPVQIGVKDDTMYVKGLFAKMEDATISGKIDGDKVVFDSGQYLGIYENGGTTAYFLGGTVKELEDEEGTYRSFKIGDNLTFAYDKEKNVLTSDGAYCISCAPDHVLYYAIGENPYICLPSATVEVKSLINPTLNFFYDVDEEYDYDAEMGFIFPDIDPEKQILPTDRLFYQIIMDGEVFTFYNDEYELPAGVTETTEIPYDYSSEETYDFYAYRTTHEFVFHTRGFETLGVRTLYKGDNGSVVYSDILWAPGYEPGSAVKGVNAANAETTECFDLNGMRISRPERGIYIVRTTGADGSVNVRKAIAK